MRYAMIDEQGALCGFTDRADNHNVVTAPLRLLEYGDQVYYDRQREQWVYQYDRAPYARYATPFSMVNYFLASFYTTRIYPRNGEIVLPKDDQISFLIPCYNKAKYIVECVESCLNQTMKPAHIIVLLMDAESIAMKDQLESLDPVVHCVPSQQLNACAARTKLVNECCPTEWFILLDADDRVEENFVKVLYEADAAVAYPAMRKMSEDGDLSISVPIEDGLLVAHGHFSACLCNNLTSLMCKTVFNEIGLDEALCKGGEDFDFHCRLMALRKYKLAYCHKACYHYRTVDGLAKKPEFFESHFKAVIKNLEFLHSEFVAANGFYTAEDAFYHNPTIDTLAQYMGGDLGHLILEIREIVDYKLYLSHQKEPMRIYDPTHFTLLNSEPYDFSGYTNRKFDVLFLETLNENNCFSNEVPMLINIDILPELAGMASWQMINYLLDNYSCFVFPNNPQMLSDDELLYQMELNAERCPVLAEQLRLMKTERRLVECDPQHQVTFTLHKGCNLCCEYCHQGYDKQNPLTDDEMFENFDKALTYFEGHYEGIIIPKIIGGEPTMWSDEFVQRILDRLDRYRQIIVFSNGTNKDSLWYTDDRTMVVTHITDWKEHPEKVYRRNLMPKEIALLVVTHEDLPILEEYVENDPLFSCFSPSPCMLSPIPALDCTDDDLARIARLTNEHFILPNGTCEANKGIEVDCETMLGRWCCKYTQYVTLDQIAEHTEQCKQCVLYREQ